MYTVIENEDLQAGFNLSPKGFGLWALGFVPGITTTSAATYCTWKADDKDLGVGLPQR